MAVQIVPEKCISCGICVKECPVNAVSLIVSKGGKKLPEIGNDCNDCGNCVKSCPKDAIIPASTNLRQQIPGPFQQNMVEPWSFTSYTKGWKSCIAREKEYWEQTDRNLSRALRFAKGNTEQKYMALREKVMSALEAKRAESESEDERAKREITQRYADEMEAATKRVIESYEKATKRRLDDYENYCKKQENSKTAKEYAEVAALFSKAGMRGYKDSDERAKQCFAEATRITEESEKTAAAAAEKLRESIALRDQERKKLEAEIDSLSKELAQTKGLFAGKRKKELEDQIMLTKSKLQKL